MGACMSMPKEMAPDREPSAGPTGCRSEGLGGGLCWLPSRLFFCSSWRTCALWRFLCMRRIRRPSDPWTLWLLSTSAAPPSSCSRVWVWSHVVREERSYIIIILFRNVNHSLWRDGSALSGKYVTAFHQLIIIILEVSVCLFFPYSFLLLCFV